MKHRPFKIVNINDYREEKNGPIESGDIMKELGSQFGIHLATVSDIIRNKTWIKKNVTQSL